MNWSIRNILGLFSQKRALLYNTIYDCPIREFQLCEEENDYNHIIKATGSLKGLDLEKAYFDLQKQVLDKFGVDRSYERVFWLQYSILKLNVDEVINGKNNTTLVNIKKREIEELTKEKEPQDTRKINASNHRELSKWSGRDSKLLTVFEYYNDFYDMKQEIERTERDIIFNKNVRGNK